MERMEGIQGGSAESAHVVDRAGTALLAGLSQCDVRMEKIAALQAKIAAGTYRIPAEALAECLMAEMRAGAEAEGWGTTAEPRG